MFIYHCTECHHELQWTSENALLSCEWCGAGMKVIGEEPDFADYLETHFNHDWEVPHGN